MRISTCWKVETRLRTNQSQTQQERTSNFTIKCSNKLVFLNVDIHMLYDLNCISTVERSKRLYRPVWLYLLHLVYFCYVPTVILTLQFHANLKTSLVSLVQHRIQKNSQYFTVEVNLFIRNFTYCGRGIYIRLHASGPKKHYK